MKRVLEIAYGVAIGIVLAAVVLRILFLAVVCDEHNHSSVEIQYRSFMREQNDTLKEIRDALRAAKEPK